MTQLVIKNCFKHSVNEQFRQNDFSQLSDNDIQDFVKYLIECKVIPNVTVKIYTVLAEFEKLSEVHPDKNKSECVAVISEKLGLDKHIIWNILKDHKGKYNFI